MQDYGENYSEMLDDQLLALSQELDSLMPEARDALLAELDRRNLNEAEEQRNAKEEDRRLTIRMERSEVQMECPNCKLECPEGTLRCDCGHLFAQDPGDTKRCPYCAEVIQAAAVKCRFCGETLTRDSVTLPGRSNASRRFLQLVVLAVLVLILVSLVRVYYGGGVGFRIVRKDSPGFSDTIVNLDEIIGMPRIVVATKHPAVKRQMEQFGWIKTDEQVADEAKREFQREFEKNMQEIQRKTEEETRRLRKELGY